MTPMGKNRFRVIFFTQKLYIVKYVKNGKISKDLNPNIEEGKEAIKIKKE